MAYTPDPANATEPVVGREAGSAAEEFRVLKAYIATLAGFPNQYNIFRKNAIIGGDFSTNPWVRGTSFANLGSGSPEYTADRWQWIGTAAAGKVTISRSTDVPSVAQCGQVVVNSLDVQVTTIDAAIGAGDYYVLRQAIEGYNALPLMQRAVTVSFYIKAKKTGIYCAGLTNTGDRGCPMEFTINAADTWERKTLTFPASPATGTWNYTTGVGMQLTITLAAGSTFDGTNGVWGNGNFFKTASNVNAMDSVANYVRLALVQVEVGSVATAFEERPFQLEESLCQRYAYSLALTNNGYNRVIGIVVNGTTLYGAVNLPVRMRAGPSLTVSAASHFILTDTASNFAATVITFPSANREGGEFDVTASGGGMTAQRPMILASVNASASLLFTSEI